MASEHTICILALTGCGAGFLGMGGFVLTMWKGQRDDAAAQMKVDAEQTVAMNALAKQSERVEVVVQTAMSLLAKPQTANPGGGSVAT